MKNNFPQVHVLTLSHAWNTHLIHIYLTQGSTISQTTQTIQVGVVCITYCRNTSKDKKLTELVVLLRDTKNDLHETDPDYN